MSQDEYAEGKLRLKLIDFIQIGVEETFKS